MVFFIDLQRYDHEVELAAITRVVKRGWFLGGREVEGFEAAFAQFSGTAHAVAVANGTDALEIGLRALGIQAGDEVATVANAGMYATTAIRAIGATPVYVDVDAETLLMAPASLDAAMGPRTRAIVVTHLYGQMARMPEILEVAEKFGVPVVEDCAQAHGSSLAGRPAGSWGAVGTFSFYPTKNLGAYGDAGGIVTSDPAICARARQLREYGWSKRFHSAVAGGRNSRMDEIQAAVLGAKLPRLGAANRRRLEIAGAYRAALGSVEGVRPVAFDESYVAHLFVVRCADRDGLQGWLTERGIQTQIHYPVPDYLQCSQAGLERRMGSLENTERATREIVSLPCYPGLRDDEVEYIAGRLGEWRRH
jgi:aminotransferase EvaB